MNPIEQNKDGALMSFEWSDQITVMIMDKIIPIIIVNIFFLLLIKRTYKLLYINL